MSSKSKTSRRKQYKNDLERINNSDRSISEKMKARSEIEDQYYDSSWAKMQDQINEMEDQHRYALMAVLGIFSAIVGSFSQDPVTGFIVFGAIGVLAGLAFLTEPGLVLMETLSKELGENDNNLQQQQTVSSSKSSNPKKICQECGWQNSQSNNFCHDCGSKMAE